MLRKPHYLKHNVRSESPSQCIFFDTETTEVQLTPGTKRLDLLFGKACYTRKLRTNKWSTGEWFTFKTPGELWAWVDSKARDKSKLYMFAHNLVFDFTVSHGFTELPKIGYKLTKAIIDDPPTVLQFSKIGRSVCLVDTFNYFKSSVGELGQGIGLPKLTMPSESHYNASWARYTRRDVEIIKKAMLTYLSFIKVNDLGNFQFTIASQAFTAYRHRFMPVKIFIDNNRDALELARQSYHGGRTEAFFIGEQTGDFYLVDVNSMYPFVMKNNNYPVCLIGVYNHPSLEDLSGYLSSYDCVADVTVNTETPIYPTVSNDGLLFPIGKFRTVLTTPHLTIGLATEAITRVHKVAVYQRARIFDSYVDTLFRLKNEYKAQGNDAFALMAKYLLNTLYGKFGQAGRVYEDVGTSDSDAIKAWTEYDAETHEVTKYREFAGVIQAWKSESESFNSHPAICSHVTAHAQCYLWELINLAGIDNTFYCDTDSLVINKTGHDRLMALYAGDSLGELKMVKQFKRLVIHTLKDYEFDDMVKRKGIRKDAIETGPGDFIQDKFGKFKSMLRAGDLDSMIVTRQAKGLKRDYRKGNVASNGRVAPYIYPEEDDYHRWLLKPRKVKTSLDFSSLEDKPEPQYRLAINADKTEARRNKSMIYQRRR